MDDNNEMKNSLNIELPGDVGEGSYSNLAVIGHSGYEFIIDFIRVMPGLPKAKVFNRIIMTPENAKRLLMTLESNINDYEDQFGEIKLHNEPINNIPMGFGASDAKA